MSQLRFPDLLSNLVKDYNKSFWNGDGEITIYIEDLLEIIENNPKITIAGLKQEWGRRKGTDYIGSGLDFDLNGEKTLTLGSPNGNDKGFSVGLNLKAGIDAMLHIILSQKGIRLLEDEYLDNLKEI